MRKILLVLALLMMAFTAKSQKFSAVCESGQTLYYNIIDEENHYVEVAQQKSMTGSIIIPSNVTYNGIDYTVTAIGNYAFMDCKSLTDITIPNSVKYIGYNAFDGSGLVSVTIPESVEIVEPGAFYNCQNLTSLTIENPMTKMHNGDMGAIASCSNVTISLATTPLKLEKGTFEIVTKKWEYPYEDQEGVEILVYYIWVPSGMAKVYNATDWSKVFIIKDE